MKEKNQRDSRKRLNALILLVAFTAILLIVSTYAWFSTHKTVKLGGLEGKVNVAEGLQISLDALNWANEIDLTNNAEAYFAQTNADLGLDGTGGKSKLSLLNPWKASTDDTYTYEARTNTVPSEFLPVSTTAQEDEGIGLTDFNMYRGEFEGTKLTDIKNFGPTDPKAGYYAIDFFLQNSSSEKAIEDNTKDILRLDSSSSIVLGATNKASTGIQNTFRVAFAIFEDDGTDANVKVNSTPNQAQILSSTTGSARTIQDVAIWEPNASGAEVKGEAGTVKTYAAHVNYVIQNNNKVTFSKDLKATYPNNRFSADQYVPTYALTSASKTAGTLENVYNWGDTPATGLVKQNTNQTANTGFTGEFIELKSTKDGTSSFSIDPGKYVRLRMYVWLEGQDVDCINYASLGGSMTINVGLSKPGTNTDVVPGP